MIHEAHNYVIEEFSQDFLKRLVERN